MAYGEKSQEKASDRREKGQGKFGRGEERHHRDPQRGTFFELMLLTISASTDDEEAVPEVFFGLMLLTIGGVYIVRAQLPDPGLWWAWVLVGIGIISLLDACICYSRPEWWKSVFGRLVLGVILVILGGSAIYSLEISLALILVGVGALTVYLVIHNKILTSEIRGERLNRRLDEDYVEDRISRKEYLRRKRELVGEMK
jgi:hypothetical protein